MTDYQAIVIEKLEFLHKRDSKSKSNQIFYIQEYVIKSVVSYAKKHEFTEQQFEIALDESMFILDGLYSSFEPYRESTGDIGDFWLHQYINPKKYITDPKNSKLLPYSANGHLEDYVQRYIEHPSMHNRYLTSLLLDAFLYNDTILFLNSVRDSWYSRNIIYPSNSFLISKALFSLTCFALAVFLGVVIHSNSPELLTPYVLVLIYVRYKALKSQPAKDKVKEIFNYSMETYVTNSNGYQYDQMATLLRNSHEKYGIRYTSTMYELVDLLKQPRE
jgi:hypothetical protein